MIIHVSFHTVHSSISTLFFVADIGIGWLLKGGGVYDDKAATIERIKTTIRDVLPQNVRDRLVLENDEASRF